MVLVAATRAVIFFSFKLYFKKFTDQFGSNTSSLTQMGCICYRHENYFSTGNGGKTQILFTDS